MTNVDYSTLNNDEVAKLWQQGDFDVRVALELARIDKERPYIIWRNETNKPTARNPRTVTDVVPFVQYLDHIHGTMDQIIRYQAEGKRVAASNIPTSKDEEREGELQVIRQYLAGQKAEIDSIRKEIEAQLRQEMGISAKAKSKKELEN